MQTDTYIGNPGATLGSPAKFRASASCRSSEWTSPRSIPASIGADQLYYWSAKWQADDAEAQADLDAGRTSTFSNAQDAIRWLLSGDD